MLNITNTPGLTYSFIGLKIIYYSLINIYAYFLKGLAYLFGAHSSNLAKHQNCTLFSIYFCKNFAKFSV